MSTKSNSSLVFSQIGASKNPSSRATRVQYFWIELLLGNYVDVGALGQVTSEGYYLLGYKLDYTIAHSE